MRKPSLPVLRPVKDTAINLASKDNREVIRNIIDEPILWGQLVSVEFSAPATPVRVLHGLDRKPVGYVVVRRSAAITVYDASDDPLYVQADGAGTVKLYVF